MTHQARGHAGLLTVGGTWDDTWDVKQLVRKHGASKGDTYFKYHLGAVALKSRAAVLRHLGLEPAAKITAPAAARKRKRAREAAVEADAHRANGLGMHGKRQDPADLRIRSHQKHARLQDIGSSASGSGRNRGALPPVAHATNQLPADHPPVSALL